MAEEQIIRAIDLETTGLDPATATPCEIAFCDVVRDANKRRWRVAGGWPILVDPGCPIPPEASAIHHIVDADVAGAPSWPEAIDGIIADLPPAAILAAHHAKFERQWLTDEILSHGLFVTPLICTYKAALRIWPDAPAHNLQTLRHWRRPVGLDRRIADQAHRAYPDAYTTAYLLRDALNGGATVEQLIEWSSTPSLLRTCQLGQYRGKPWSEVDSGFLEWILRPGRDFDEDVVFTARTELERRAQERAGGVRRGRLL